MTITLGELKVGDRGRVAGFGTGDIGHRQKLLSMGLTPGTEFTIVRVAPLGDPVELRVRDTSISLRRDEVSALSIERLGTGVAAEEAEPRTIAIIGNPNCGKSTLFNGLTGANQKVGNWPGVTVEKKVGLFWSADQRFKLVDLPGIYSLDAYNEACAIDERIARDYVLSGEADLIINLVDTSHLELSLYLTTQLLEMRVPVVVVLNIMEEDDSRRAKFDVEAIERRLGCPVKALVASRRREVEELKSELQQLARERSLPRFRIDYPPLIEDAIADLSRAIEATATPADFDGRWLAIRLLERDAFATRHVDAAVRVALEQLAGRIAQATGQEADILVANSRYRLVHTLAGEAMRKHVPISRTISARIDSVVLNRLLGIPIFLGVMYCLFWFTIKLARAFKPFVNQLSDLFFVEGFRQVLGTLHTPAWLSALLADGLGNGLLQVVSFIPIIGFLYLFLAVLEESGYMARANFVMDRLMQAIGLPGNAFVPMVVGFGCNVPSIMATRTLERPRDRIVAVLMSPFMSCGGRLAVYTIFAAAFFPDHGQFVIFGIYLLGIVFAMITALILKSSLLPRERSLYAMELPPYHWPKLRNVLISAWIRVKGFVFRVGKFIIPLVFLLQVASMWGTDGSFHKRPIDRSMLAAGGQAITPALAPMGIGQDQWPATVALLTGVLHKVVIVSTLDAIYMDSAHKPAQSFDFVERIKRAASTVPQNLMALVGLGSPAKMHQFHSGLAPALASRFDGTIGALAYLVLLLCYPCIATTSATTRETNQRWTAIMVFWTVSLGYGMAVLIYQIGTFLAHPASSAAWISGVVAYFGLIGVAAVKFAPLSANAYPLRLRGAEKQEQLAVDRLYQLAPSLKGVGWTIGGTLSMIAVGAALVAYWPRLGSREQPETSKADIAPSTPAQQTTGALSSKDTNATAGEGVAESLTTKDSSFAIGTDPEATSPPGHDVSTVENEASNAMAEIDPHAAAETHSLPTASSEGDPSEVGGQAATRTGQAATIMPQAIEAAREGSNEVVSKPVEIGGEDTGVEAQLVAFLERKAAPAGLITWFDLDGLVFESGRSTLLPASMERLQKIAGILSTYPGVRVIIGGHTDNLGKPGANRRLSRARAESVSRELTRMGVDAARLEARGYGSDQPVATNETVEGRAINRRISLGLSRE